MARPRKTGLDYFPFDVNFFSDKKIRILKARYGTNGIAIYVYLLCEVYRNGYYIVWDADYKYLVADDLNLSDGLIEQVMKFLVERSLLTSILLDTDTILTSPGIQRRFQEAVKERVRASKQPVEVKAELWLLSKDETQSSVKVVSKNVSHEKTQVSHAKNTDKSERKYTKESKVKKSKVNERRAAAPPSTPTQNDVESYIREKGYRTFTAERFCKYYDSIGWIRSGSPVTDWRSLADSWEANGFSMKPTETPQRESSFEVDELSQLSRFND